ncbi:DUF47 domain-containing protein [Swingsia samuiensis]|uniref:DUF47 family protein n=1 Tax=Swingsia samuiensis TaxID=1293412 RepID=A0A4Y6UM70_9PROT|nr:DUF47 family protein [Swingsia samuiensis]QDH17778.1 DUF47 family protein [Swingsia samuiensis]
MLAKLLAFFKLSSRSPDQHISKLAELMNDAASVSDVFVQFARASDFSSLRQAPLGEGEELSAESKEFQNALQAVSTLHLKIVEMERSADNRQKQAIESVSHALLLPFDRSHLFRFFNRADNIIDEIRKASTYSVMFQAPYSHNMLKMVERIREATYVLRDIIPQLSNVPRNAKTLTEAAERIYSLEDEVDRLHLELLTSIMSNVNPTKLAANQQMAGRYVPPKYGPVRECTDRIERVMDACKEFAEAIVTVVTDNA